MRRYKTGNQTPEYRAENRRVVSVDGEGYTVSGRHAYTLLAAADDRGYRSYIEHDGSKRTGTAEHPDGPYEPEDLAPNYGLPTEQCLEFLLSLPQNKSDVIISFAFTYDVTKSLQDLPYQKLMELRENDVTVWNGYTISAMPRKFIKVQKGNRVCTVWDTFSYWQMSFVKALYGSKELFTPEQHTTIEFIAKMKKERSGFDTMPADEIREYCFKECEFLSTMFRDFLRNFQDMDLRVNRFSGPGGLAEAFFESEGIKHHMQYYTGPHKVSGLPLQVAINSYYGGRFETSILGTVGDVIEYDLQSAYPAVAVTLPCLRCGQFKRVKDYVPGSFGFYFVGSKTSGPWAPFPFRADNVNGRKYMNGATKGSIAFVHGGKRWVGGDEVAVARKHFGNDAIPVYDGWVYVERCGHRPFKRVEELYLRRKAHSPEKCNHPPMPKPSEGLSKVIKLIINSVYGKTAQSIGMKIDENAPYHWTDEQAYKAPVFQSYIWAAWMTSGTRAKVLDAALQGGKDVVSIATDGILSTRELDLHVTDHELGSWERTPKQDCWLGMPGIYSFGKNPDDKSFKRRGLDSRYFPAKYLREKFEQGEWTVEPNKPIVAFYPYKLAMTRKNALNIVGEWVEGKKVIHFGSVQHKRNFPEDVDPIIPHDGSAIALETITVPDNVVSAPYKPKQSWEDIMNGRVEDPDIAMWEAEDNAMELAELAEHVANYNVM